MKRPLYRFIVTTFDPRAAWWCGHLRKWGHGDSGYRRCSHRYFRTLKQALTEAAVLLLRGIVDVIVAESGRGYREWWLASTIPTRGIDAARSIAWARAYLALPRRKR